MRKTILTLALALALACQAGQLARPAQTSSQPPTGASPTIIEPGPATSTSARPDAPGAPLTPGAPAALRGTPFTLDFPRLGMWWPDPWNQPHADIARYDWVIFFPGEEDQVEQVKAINPALLALNATNACEVSFNPEPDAEPWENQEARRMPAEWFLTQVGATLTEAVNATQTTLKVSAVEITQGGQTYDLFVPDEAAVLDGESVWIESVNRLTKTLTVQRGYVRPAAAHPAGTRIAAHITFWPGSWLMNLSTQSPKATLDAGIGPESWAEYHARTDAHLLDDPAWDGLLIDRADPDQSWLIGNSTGRTIDPDQSNTLPADYTAFDQGWNQGLRQYESRLRALVGDETILFVNLGMANYDLLNGNNYEGFPAEGGDHYGRPWRSTVFGPTANGGYFDWIAQARQPNLTMIETYEDDGGPDPGGDGEYDNPCVKPGFVPNYRKMRFGLATALLNDGFFSYEINTNGHGSLCLLWFDEYDNAGQGRGYLGQPLGPAVRVLPELAAPSLLPGGPMDSQDDFDNWELWTDTGYAGTVTLDTAVKHGGAASARVDITQAAGTDWQASLVFEPLALAKGQDYTLSFWARAAAPRPISAWAQQNQDPWNTWLDYQAIALTTGWQYVEIPARSLGDDAQASFNFGFGQAAGTVWLDDIRLQTGSREAWRRDYTNGVALLNATSSTQVIDLHGSFRKLNGPQAPTVNDGALVSQVTLPPLDGIILLNLPAQLVYLPVIWK